MNIIILARDKYYLMFACDEHWQTYISRLERPEFADVVTISPGARLHNDQGNYAIRIALLDIIPVCHCCPTTAECVILYIKLGMITTARFTCAHAPCVRALAAIPA